jgi:hypothetical protein
MSVSTRPHGMVLHTSGFRLAQGWRELCVLAATSRTTAHNQ